MLRRIAPAVLAAAVLAGGLAGCSSTVPTEVDRGDCTPMLGAGALSDNVVVLGGFGTDPQVSIPSDTVIPVTQRSIVDSSGVTGKNPLLAEGDTVVSVNFAFYDQATGEELLRGGEFGGGKHEFFLVSDEAPNPLSEAVRCAAAGERVVLALSPADSMPLRQQVGGDPKSSVVGVFDVEAVSKFSVEGRAKGLPNGFPAVVTNEDGQPGVVLPPRDAPIGLTSAVRIAGDGAVVTAENRVVAQALIVGWDGTVEMNTWSASGPQLIGNEEEAGQQQISYRAELTGKKVGSQVVITEGGDRARVIVVDILAAG